MERFHNPAPLGLFRSVKGHSAKFETNFPGGGAVLVATFYAVVWFLAAAVFAALLVHASPLFPKIGQYFYKNPGRVFSRIRLILCLIFLPKFLKICRLSPIETIGFRKISWKNFFLVFAIGITFVAAILLWEGNGHAVVIGTIAAPTLVFNFAKFVLAAGIIGLIEETIFRGFVFNLLARDYGKIPATIVASLFFALCHSDRAIAPQIPRVDAAFFSVFKELILSFFVFFRTIDWTIFFNLTMFGMVLSVLLLKFRSLLFPIAFHFGVVLALMNVRQLEKITRLAAPHAPSAVKILNSWTTFTLQGILLLCLFFSLRNRRER
jgi:membrane protease YdiL (CAAX protease family)